MTTRILVVCVFLLALFAVPGRAATCGTDSDVNTCTNTVSPADNTAIYDFTGTGNGYLTVQFDTVLTTFTLTVTLNPTLDPLDPKEFPAGTACVHYSGHGTACTQYDFTGSAGGPNGVPVKGKDYKGLITLSLSYFTDEATHKPAFGHAPGDNASAVYTEDILTSFSADPVFIITELANRAGQPTSGDPTMGGKVPGLSSLAALDEPPTDSAVFCSLTATPTNNASDEKPQVEILLKLVASGACTGAGLRDKTASLSVSTTESGNIVFPAVRNVEGNKFHWDNKNGLNEYDISLDGLNPGQTYTVTVFSSKFSPQKITFTVPN